MGSMGSMPHRDDLPMDMATELTQKLQEAFPGYTVGFAADKPGGPGPELQEKLAEFERVSLERLAEGRCGMCNKQLPCEWPPPEEGDWSLPEGWGFLTILGTDEPAALECDECGAEVDAAGGLVDIRKVIGN